jgi:hypothetical protein
MENARYLLAGDPEMELDIPMSVVAGGRRCRARGWVAVGGVKGGDGEREGNIGGKNFWEKKMAEAF